MGQSPSRFVAWALAAAVGSTSACSAPADVDDGGLDLGEPATDAGGDASTGRDAGVDTGVGSDGLTDEQRAFVAAVQHAACVGSLCDPRIDAFHGDADACVRSAENQAEFPTLVNALASGVVMLDPAHEAACLAELAACPQPVFYPPDDPCSAALARAHPRADGDACSIDTECAADEVCGGAGSGTVSGSGDICPQLRCVPAEAVGDLCGAGIVGGCSRSPDGVTFCFAGRCILQHNITVADGAACGRTGPAADGTYTYASCPDADICKSGASGFHCVARPTAGQPCNSGDCAPGLSCRGPDPLLCTVVTYLGPGDHGCAAEGALVCDASRGVFCDLATDTCVPAGDGSLGSACEPLLFPCDLAHECRDSVCVARLPLGSPCGGESAASCAGACGPLDTCIECPGTHSGAM